MLEIQQWLLAAGILWIVSSVGFLIYGKPTRRIVWKDTINGTCRLLGLAWVMLFIIFAVSLVPAIIDYIDNFGLESTSLDALWVLQGAPYVFVSSILLVAVFGINRWSGFKLLKYTEEEIKIMKVRDERWKKKVSGWPVIGKLVQARQKKCK